MISLIVACVKIQASSCLYGLQDNCMIMYSLPSPLELQRCKPQASRSFSLLPNQHQSDLPYTKEEKSTDNTEPDFYTYSLRVS
ncbi:hypothetical protein VTL71DRAFT_11821 [Oculimacula yallundae]|uniref:Uncharacterized protein n=1 Tax=Oculimacula yallundae TaxID=86028 RepID=A0ABR4CRT9_9HELO